MSSRQVAWSLFVELRKELVESQRIRAQVVGFKITFVSASVGLIATNLDKISTLVLVVPAFAAIFFDFLINNYNLAIARIGNYIRTEIEPVLKRTDDWPENFHLWQEYASKTQRRYPARLGNLGITLLAIGAAIIGLVNEFNPLSSSFLIILLLTFFVIDVATYATSKDDASC